MSDSWVSSYCLFLKSFNKLSFKVSRHKKYFVEPTFAFIDKCKLINLLNATNYPNFYNGPNIY